MIILGIHDSHDAGAVLLKDGKVIAAADEERFNHIKHSAGLPLEAARFVMNYANVRPEEVDAVAVPFCSANSMMKRALKLKPSLAPRIYAKHLSFEARIKGLCDFLGITTRNVFFIDHHRSHAAAAFYTSGFSDATVLTMDGAGDMLCGTVNKGCGHEIKTIHQIPESQSPGLFYAVATDALGFTVNSDEGKTMALASFTSRSAPITELDLIKPNANGFVTRLKFDATGVFADSRFTIHFNESKIFGDAVAKYGEVEVAASAQVTFEKCMLDFVKKSLDKVGSKNLALGGGVFLNVKLNKRIMEMADVDIYPFPHAGDGGLALGAALEAHKIMCGRDSSKPDFEKLNGLYLGPEFTDEEIENELKKHGALEYERSADICGETAELIDKGDVVGWFQGRMEYGPRALGNRSVIADPRDPKMKEKINKILKGRKEFQPFAPSILAERAPEFFVNARPSPYMILAFDVIEKRKKDIPAVTHVDGTARPQTVEKDVNPRYYELISKFEKLSGVPIVLNTSFNLHGLPIVCKPREAVQHLEFGSVDALAIGNFIVKRK